MSKPPPLFPPVASPSSTMMQLHQMSRGGILYSAELARHLGELLLEAHYGQDELERQLPLTVEDKGDTWSLGGSWNRDRKLEGNGAFFMSVQKHDARVLDFGCWAICHPPPEVQAIINAELQRRKDEGER